PSRLQRPLRLPSPPVVLAVRARPGGVLGRPAAPPGDRGVGGTWRLRREPDPILPAGLDAEHRLRRGDARDLLPARAAALLAGPRAAGRGLARLHVPPRAGLGPGDRGCADDLLRRPLAARRCERAPAGADPGLPTGRGRRRTGHGDEIQRGPGPDRAPGGPRA